MKNIIGLAIGQKDIKLAHICLNGKNAELLSLDAIEIPPTTNQYEIASLIKLIFKNNQLKVNVPISLSVSAEETFLKIVSVKTRGTKKFKDLVRDEFKKNVVLSLDECFWDYSLLYHSPKDNSAEVLAVAAKKTAVLDKVKLLEEANGFIVDLITLDALAVYNCLKFNTELSSGKRYAVVDISCGKTQVFIFDDKENFWLKTIPLGEDKFIEAIAKKLGVSTKEAQEYKRNVLLAGNNLATETDNILSPLMKEVALELGKTFNYYYFQAGDSPAKESSQKKIDEILLSGSGSIYPNLDKLLLENLNIPTRYIYPLNKIIIKDKKLLTKKNLLGIKSIEFALPIGLALTGLSLARIKINLLKETKKNFLQRIKLSYVYNAFIIICIGLLVSLWTQKGLSNKEINTLNSKLKELSAISQQAIPQIDNLKQAYEKIDIKVKALNTAVSNRNLISRILYKISEIIADDVWLTNFIFNLDYQENKGELTLSGKAYNYAGINKLISGLKDTGCFRSIQPVSSKVKIDEITKEEVVNFIIKLEIGK